MTTETRAANRLLKIAGAAGGGTAVAGIALTAALTAGVAHTASTTSSSTSSTSSSSTSTSSSPTSSSTSASSSATDGLGVPTQNQVPAGRSNGS